MIRAMKMRTFAVGDPGRRKWARRFSKDEVQEMAKRFIDSHQRRVDSDMADALAYGFRDARATMNLSKGFAKWKNSLKF